MQAFFGFRLVLQVLKQEMDLNRAVSTLKCNTHNCALSESQRSMSQR